MTCKFDYIRLIQVELVNVKLISASAHNSLRLQLIFPPRNSRRTSLRSVLCSNKGGKKILMTVDSQIYPGTNLELDIKSLLTTDKACSIQRQEGTPDRKSDSTERIKLVLSTVRKERRQADLTQEQNFSESESSEGHFCLSVLSMKKI